MPNRVSLAKLKHLYLVETLNLRQIRAVTGLSEAATWQRLKRAGVPMRSRRDAVLLVADGGQARLTREKVIQTYALDGNSIRVAAKSLGVSIEALRRFMKRHGIPRRRRNYAEFAESRYEEILDVKAMVDDYTKRMLSIITVARRHGTSPDRAREVLVENGVVIRPCYVRKIHTNQYTKSCSKAA